MLGSNAISVRPGRTILVTLTVVVVTLIAVVGVSTVSSASKASASATRAAMFDASPAELRAGAEELQRNAASGWVPYEAAATADGPAIRGWVPIGADATSLLPAFDRIEARLPVHAEQGGGEVVGYIYEYVGFVPAGVADSGSFDAQAARSKAAGCDPVLADGSTDTECAAGAFKALTD